MALPYEDHEAWFNLFVSRRIDRRRKRVIALLPMRLSGAWRSTLQRAARLATEQGQHSVAERLYSIVQRDRDRGRTVDAQTDDGSRAASYLCSRCGEMLPADAFGVRRPTRRPKVDEKGNIQMRPNWTVAEVLDPGEPGGRATVRIVSRQAQCTSCRGRA